jgi:SWI/SNF-related matrix-associated actin-dependent regulator of chromatin subfamily A3
LKDDKLVKAGELKQTRKANEMKRDLEKSKMGLKSDRSSAGFASREAGLSMDELVQLSQSVTFRSGDDMAKTMAMDEDQLSKLPMASQPGSLTVKLLPYQLQGLAWLHSKENPQFPPAGSQDSVQLWKRDAKGLYKNLATKFAVKNPPHLLSGGILADDMGLGKTLQVISLILTGGPGPTLVVAPVTVMSNWQQQVARHIKEEVAPDVIVYHGNNKNFTKEDMKKSGVVITSYGTLATSFRAGNSPLFSVNWRRIVLDEGHTIRNPQTKVAEAACALAAQSRWILSGTPIVNNLKDIYSLIKFLRITGGIENFSIFSAVITRGINDGNTRSMSILQSLMRDLCLRRHKEMSFVNLKLPPKEEYVYRISFWPEEHKKYDALHSEAVGALKQYQANATASKGGLFQHVLERLLRLRQTCCHWTLCRQRINDLMKLLEDQNVVELNDENRKILQEALRLYIESQEDCCVCLDSLRDPVITHCKHVYCRSCIGTVISTQKKCPMCRADLDEDKLVSPAVETAGDEIIAEEGTDTELKSSKTEALLRILGARLKNEGSKVIIFSQWTSFLNVIQRQLDEAGHRYTRIDGSMSAAQRDKAMYTLDKDPDTRVLLASLAVASVGLNLVAADTVILADSWWAPAIEDQAVDRVHRLGQTRPCTVWRLVMEQTVEDRVLQIQEEKRKLVGHAFMEKKTKKTKETRTADIVRLLG